MFLFSRLLKSSYYSVIMRDAPIRYYRLGELSGTIAKDSSASGQDGTISGGVTMGQSGLLRGDVNGAMLFDGSTGYVNCPTTGLPTGANPWTIEIWTSTPNTNVYYNALCYFGTNSNLEFAGIYLNTNKFLVVLYDTNVIGATTVGNDTTYYVAGTYDGTTVRLFVNGHLDASGAYNLNIVEAYCQIGARQSASVDYFAGTLDEAAIYNYALSADQIAHHYHAGLASEMFGHAQRMSR